MIDHETWVILGDNLARIQRAREIEVEIAADDVCLEFDADDQARVVHRRFHVHPPDPLPS